MYDLLLGAWAVSGATVLVLLIKGTGVLLVAWLLTSLTRGASAAVRHGIWTAALVTLILLPLLGRWMPAWNVDLPVQITLPTAEVVPQTVPVTVGPAVLSAGTPGPVEPAAGMTPTFAESGHAPAARWRSVTLGDWVSLLLLVWVIGVLLRAIWLAALFNRLHRLSAAARDDVSGRSLRHAVEVAAQLGITREIRILHTPIVSMPLAWGVSKPVVLLPRDIDKWPVERLRVVLLHELAHIRRADYLSAMIAEIACAIYWPIPLVWHARRRQRIEQEQACDDRVLLAGTRPLDYAEHLLAVARNFRGDRRELEMAVTMARETNLKSRVQAILDDRTDRGPLVSTRGVVTTLLLAAACIPLAALRGAAEPAPDSEDPRSSAPPSEVAEPSVVSPFDLHLWFEAEHGELGRGAVIDENLSASGAAYVLLEPSALRVSDPSGPSLDATFSIPVAGDYLLWARMILGGGDDVQPMISIDGGREIAWRLPATDPDGRRAWTWVPLVDLGDESDTPATFALAHGGHSVRLRSARGELRIDRLMVTGDPAAEPSGFGPAEAGFVPAYQLLEAEEGGTSGIARAISNDDASGKSYVAFRTARGRYGDGVLSIDFDIESAGRYLIWGRISAPDESALSLFAQVGDAPEIVWDITGLTTRWEPNDWLWIPLIDRNGSGRGVDPVILELEPGTHTARFRARKDGLRLDAVLVTNDLAHRPRGVWPASLPQDPDRVWLEGEAAEIAPPVSARRHSTASGAEYIVAEIPRRGPPRPEGAGIARFNFDVDNAGIYSLWARTIAASDANDSFWVRVNGGSWIRWNRIPKGDSWTWSAVEDDDQSGRIVQFDLTPGSHQLEVAGRDDGAMLDRLLVTNDPLADPASFPAD